MAMRNPSHPGDLIRDSMEAEGWTVTECAERLGVARHTLSRLLNGHAVFRRQWLSRWSISAGVTPTIG